MDNLALMAEWNWEKNSELGVNPQTLTLGSGKKVWWICSKSHKWQARIDHRNNGSGCPYCSNNKVLPGYNDLATLNPTLAKEWNYALNQDLKPEDFTANSGKKVWWICSKGHNYQAAIINKNKGAGYPYCSNQKLLQGYNDLETLNPLLAKEWNYSLNKELKPSDVFSCGHQNIWWNCEKGHTYQAKIYNRTNGRGCPYCSSNRVLSGESDLATLNPLLTKEWNYTLNKDLQPFNVLPNSNKKVWWNCSKGHEWRSTIASRTNGSGCPFCSNKKVLPGYNDLATLNPCLAKEWNYALNQDLKPEDFTANSRKKVWWKCPQGHEYQARVDHRNNGSGCPHCYRQRKSHSSPKNKN